MTVGIVAEQQMMLARIADSPAFGRVILGAILLGAVTVGLETSRTMLDQFGGLLHGLDKLVITVFAIEAAIKMGRHGRRFWLYFKDPWNVFDFAILAICLMPMHAQYAAVLRLVRVLRTLRLVTAIPRLQLLVTALAKALPSMGYVGALLGLHFYIFGVLGVFLWGGNDPSHFRDLPTSLLTLFRVITLEDWTDVMYIQIYGSDVYPMAKTGFTATEPVGRPVLGSIYFVSFVLFGTMIMLNLFIGVVINSMNEAERELTKKREDEKHERPARTKDEDPLVFPHGTDTDAMPPGRLADESELLAIEEQLALLQSRLRDMRLPAEERSA